jgi:diguanylate cyclase (GGDEF)-like protein/PAS domain S-box-containing protein
MNISNLIPVFLMITSAVIALMVSSYSWRWRTTSGGVYFSLLMAAVSFFALTSAGELSASSLEAKITWSKISYLGIVSVSPLWFLFAAAYSGRNEWLTPPRYLLIGLIPTATLILAFTNDWHGFIWPEITLDANRTDSLAIYAHGIGFWIHVGYAYLMMLAGTTWLIMTALRSPWLFRRQIIHIIAAALVPWIGNAIYVFDINPWPGLELTPIGFIFSGLILAWNLFRYQMLDLAPIALSVLFENISDGVIVLDNHNRVVDLNPIAREWIGVDQKIIGRPVIEVLPMKEITSKFLEANQVHSQFEIKHNDERRFFDVKISPLRNNRNQVQGRIAWLHDITHERAMLNTEQRRARQLETLNIITLSALNEPDLSTMLQNLAVHLGELFEADGAYLTLWDSDNQRVLPAAANGNMKEIYPSFKLEPGEKTISQSVLQLGQVLVIENPRESPYVSQRIAEQFPSQSMLAIPLIAAGKRLGAALISYHAHHAFTSEEKTLAEQVAAQISLAIAKTQSVESENRRAAQMTALQLISQVVASTLDLNQVFTTVVNTLHHTFKYDFVSIYLLEGEILHLKAQIGYPEEMIFWHITTAQGITGRTVRTRRPQFVRDVHSDPDFLRASHGVTSEICVPLIKENLVLGTLNIETTSQSPLTESDLELLTAFGSQVVIAIENASLYQSERQQRELAEALREVGIALSESLDFDTVLDRLLDGIQRVIPFDAASVLILEDNRQKARVIRQLGYGENTAASKQPGSPAEISIASTPRLRRMLDTGRPLIITDTSRELDWLIEEERTLFRSWAGAPIIIQGKVTAFLSLHKTEVNFYLPDHLPRLSAFTGHAAVAIENARLFSEIQQRSQKERLLLAAARDFTAKLGEEAVLQAISRHLINASGWTGCTISQWDQANDNLVTLLDTNTNAAAPVETSLTYYPLSQYPISRQVLESRRPIQLRSDDPFIDPSEMALLRKYANETVLMLPLVAGQGAQVYGLVELFGELSQPPISESDLELLQNITAQAATALENANLYTKVQRLAIVDDLTGLYNRRGFYEHGRREMERAVRLERSLGALFLDIDHFKNFNDLYGYTVGDQVLRLLAACLRTNLREIDLIGRYGGEEFVVLLPEANLDSARKVAERLRRTVESLRVRTDQGDVHFTISIGVCMLASGISELDKLVMRSGQALHEAKVRGRNRVYISET